MSLIGKLVKNITVKTAVGIYGTYTEAKDAIQTEIDMAAIENLEEDQKAFNDQIAHMSKEDQEKAKRLAEIYAMQEVSKSFAKDGHKLAKLKYKYKDVLALGSK